VEAALVVTSRSLGVRIRHDGAPTGGGVVESQVALAAHTVVDLATCLREGRGIAAAAAATGIATEIRGERVRCAGPGAAPGVGGASRLAAVLVGQVEEVPYLVREHLVLLLVEQITLGFDPDELRTVAAAGGRPADVIVDECTHDVVVRFLGPAVLSPECILDRRNPAIAGRGTRRGREVHTVQYVQMKVVAARRHTHLREEVVEHRGREAAELAQRTLPADRYGGDLQQAGAGILVEEPVAVVVDVVALLVVDEPVAVVVDAVRHLRRSREPEPDLRMTASVVLVLDHLRLIREVAGEEGTAGVVADTDRK